MVYLALTTVSCHDRSVQNRQICARNVPRVHGHEGLDDDATVR